MKDKLTPFDFIAQIFSEIDTKNEGYSLPTRWLCLRNDLQKKYKTKAIKMYNDWKNDELKALERRQFCIIQRICEGLI